MSDILREWFVRKVLNSIVVLLAQFAQLSQFATYGQDFLSYHDTKPGQQV